MFYSKKVSQRYCWLFLLFSFSASAQQPVLSLKELLDSVTNHSPALLADSAAVSIKQAREEVTRYNRLPSLKVNYQADLGTNNNMPGGYFSYGIVPGNSRVRTEGNGSTILTDLGIIAFDWELYNFGGFEAQQKAARSDVNVEQAKFQQAKFQWQTYTISAYLQLMRLADLQVIQSQNIQRNTEIRRSIQALAKSGIIAGVDTSIAEAEISRARLNYLELSNQLRQIQLQLSSISGIDPGRILPDTAMDTRLAGYFKTFSFLESDTTHHPVIDLYKSMYQNSLDKEELIRKSYNPKISLQAAAWGRGASVSAADEFRPLVKGLGFERGNYLVGVGIIYNIFDGKRKNLQLGVQKASTDLVQRELNEQQVLLSLNISQADTELQTAEKRLEEIPHLLAAAQAAYRQKLSLYKNGLTNLVDLNAALTILYRAETEYTNANYQYCKALFQKATNENVVDVLLNTIK